MGTALTWPAFSPAAETRIELQEDVCGSCQRANLINLRVLDQNGSSSDSVVISAIQKAISLKSTYKIRVINLSRGRPVYESYTLDPLCQAVEQAWRAGIVVVVAAGNDGRNTSGDVSPESNRRWSSSRLSSAIPHVRVLAGSRCCRPAWGSPHRQPSPEYRSHFMQVQSHTKERFRCREYRQLLWWLRT
jgi:subtilisin family serine protease